MSTSASSRPAAEPVGPFQLAILVLSVLALAAVAADTFFKLPTEISRVLQGVDLIVCLVFFVDFLVRFRAAESKGAFLRWGWIDLLASIPTLDFARAGRLIRMLRVLRLIRGIQSIKRLLSDVYAHRLHGGVTTVVLMMFLLVVFSSIGILAVENTPGGNIHSASDAVWWSVTTVTTVGYGDRYPVTAEGRAIAIGLMVAGVGMFGALSGVIASLFLGRSEAKDDAIVVELRAMRAELAELREQRARPPTV